jgi:hypothetical protein
VPFLVSSKSKGLRVGHGRVLDLQRELNASGFRIAAVSQMFDHLDLYCLVGKKASWSPKNTTPQSQG